MKLLLVLPLVILAAAPPKRPPPPPHPGAAPPLSVVRRSDEVLGAACTTVAEGRGDSTSTALALSEAWDEMARLDDILGARAGSELGRLNALAATERFACSPDLYAAIDSALDVAEETGGLFDPTIEPLARAWDLRGAGRVPAADEIAAARRQVGWRAVARDPGGRVVRFTRPGMALDLDDIARGYALERAAAALRARGIARALLSLDDQTLALSNREPWQVPIALPGDRPEPGLRLALTNAALSTCTASGPGGTIAALRHARVLDPRSGMTVRTDASVSVVARSATRANALSAALLVMGRERAAAFVADHPGLGALWLEPTTEGVNAWAWNLPAVAAEPGVNVVWKTPR